MATLANLKMQAQIAANTSSDRQVQQLARIVVELCGHLQKTAAGSEEALKKAKQAKRATK